MPFSVICFLKISTFSTLPLLIKDHLHVTYFALIISYMIIFRYLIDIAYSTDKKTQRNLKIFQDFVDLIVVAASISIMFLPAPARFPYLWPFLISFFCCMYFIVFLFECSFLQYRSFLANSKTLKLIPLKIFQ